MKAYLKKWGNSFSVRIPMSVVEAAHLELDQLLDIREEDGRIILEPVEKVEFDLGELVKGITKKNLHKETDFGAPVGGEIW